MTFLNFLLNIILIFVDNDLIVYIIDKKVVFHEHESSLLQSIIH